MFNVATMSFAAGLQQELGLEVTEGCEFFRSSTLICSAASERGRACTGIAPIDSSGVLFGNRHGTQHHLRQNGFPCSFERIFHLLLGVSPTSESHVPRYAFE